jgi:uncharacterized protein (DUF1697 family)
MQTYISFLRGINMTGHNTIKMTDLGDLYRKLGLKDVETYIQSGNVIFSGDDRSNEYELGLMIEKAISEKFNYIVPVMIRTYRELADLFTSNPFLEEPDFDPSKMAVIFLHSEPSDNQLQKVTNVSYPPDKFKIINREIFIYCPNGFGTTKIYTNFFEKKMKVSGTGRNWKTITTILSMSEKKI